MEAKNTITEPRDSMADAKALSAVVVETDWLLENLENPKVVVLEVHREGGSEGKKNVDVIPGARRVHWKNLLWDTNRRDFADPQTLANRLGALGISSDAEIVVAGDPIQFGTYGYLALKMAGNEKVRMLNGGKALWVSLGLPVSSESADYAVVDRPAGALDKSALVGREEVLASLGSADVEILDVRTDEEYLGERVSPRSHVIDNGAQAWGRIPGATHLFYGSLLAPDGRFLDRTELVKKFQAAGVDFDNSVFLYCRLGHRASLAWFALSQIVGLESARVYDGSWTEWGSMVGMPVER
jgi:thiosulfate/3-mercaptopyruvate sulfurtransferase